MIGFRSVMREKVSNVDLVLAFLRNHHAQGKISFLALCCQRHHVQKWISHNPLFFFVVFGLPHNDLHEKQSKMSRLQFRCLTSKHTFWDIMTGWMKKRWRELPDMLTNMSISVHHFQHQEKKITSMSHPDLNLNCGHSRRICPDNFLGVSLFSH